MKKIPLSDIFSEKIKFLAEKKTAEISGLYGSSLSFFLGEFHQFWNDQIIFISSDFEKLQYIAEDLEEFCPEQVVLFPRLESIPFEFKISHPERQSRYQNGLLSLVQRKQNIILIPLETFLLKTVSTDQIKNEYIELKIDEEIDRDSFLEFLHEYGYTRAEAVEEIGDFAVRGSIIDVFPFQSQLPIRIEFFGDTITSIRTFDILNQRSLNSLDSFTFSSHFFQHHKSFSTPLHHFFASSAKIMIDEPILIENKLHEWYSQLNEAIQEQDVPEDVYLSEDQVSSFMNEENKFRITAAPGSNQSSIHFPFRVPTKFHGSLKFFFKYLSKHSEQNTLQKVTVYCENEKRKENLLQFLEDEFPDGDLPKLVTLPVSVGFKNAETDEEFLTEHEIFNRIRSGKFKKSPVATGNIIRKLNKINHGDIVVHVDYGIGIYDGVEKIRIGDSAPKDIIKLIYRDDDILYVSLDKINKIQKYTSTKENYVPELTKLGSTEWSRIRKKTKKEIEKIAADLIQLYAMRMTRKGFTFSEDTVWQREMESMFPFDETPDQLRCIDEVKLDMQSDKPMDRLLCGDVGYGKTEVAIRAAFKAVQDGKQVAVLVPTTLLANQHYHTFKDRLKDFPVEIEMMSRFRSRKQQTEILEKLAKKQVDIIIGTHRLLSNDVRFSDLGLLIIDEEQRFGVKHKEKIKQYKATIDVLTMSATPIPRTLHMALIGVRNLSQIETPPKNRLPIYTEISVWDDNLIRRAILKEIKRGGQIFFVHNRVETIYAVKDRIQALVPEAKFIVGHGQMKESELERVMEGFYNKQYDVLVATMIIENGIDIPSCNTIFVNDAHKLGLAQLYQLRGRVGRSENQAYAYLIVPSIHKLKKDALKRLFALQEFTELGAGIKIAMKDLEIRGAGNLLGARQSGQINAIGYDLYIKTLNEAIEKIKNSEYPELTELTTEKLTECTVEISADIYLPDDYVGSQSEKAFIYYRLGQLTAIEQMNDIEAELIDRFGPIPEPAQNLLFLHTLRIIGSNNYISRFQLTEKKLIITFHSKFLENKTNFDYIVSNISNLDGFQCQFKQEKQLKLVILSKSGSLLKNNFELTKKILQDLIIK
ncbi:MAG: transcription-repair coupling factor [Calditrichia bacterium]